MLFKNHILIFVFTALILPVFSQIVPGYQGRKNIVSYRDNLSVSFDEPTFFNKTVNTSIHKKADESIFIPFNNTHSLTFERVIGRKVSCEANYSFMATKTYVSLRGSIYDPLTGQSNPYEFSEIKTNIFGHYFTGALKFYGRRALAPVGTYFKVSFGYCVMKGKLLPEVELKTSPTSQNSPSTIYTFEPGTGYFDSNALSLGFTLGSHRVFKSHWVVNRGLSLNFLFNETGKSTFTDAYLQMNGRTYNHDVFTFFLGLGYLF